MVRTEVFRSVLRGRAILDKGLAGKVKLLEAGALPGGGRARIELEQRSHAGEERGVQAIGLRELAGGLGETARLARVDLDEGQACLGEGLLEGGVIRSGRLEDDAGRIRSDPGDQSLVALLGVWEPAAFAIRETISVQRLFRDVDANGNLSVIFSAPLLVIRAATPGYPFRPKEKTRAVKL